MGADSDGKRGYMEGSDLLASLRASGELAFDNYETGRPRRQITDEEFRAAAERIFGKVSTPEEELEEVERARKEHAPK